MLIGELCKQSGLSKDGIRHYEQLGLLHSSPKSAGTRTYRDYHADSLKRLELIQCGKDAGFSLKEMQPLLELFVSGQLSKEQKDNLLKQKLEELESREKAIQQMKAVIQAQL